ncbi:MAG TPA: CAP domain-containing protein [Bacillus bacterium]|nr:CAP domain-containing protein [Bacillus sp. (in: firmicutes)]
MKKNILILLMALIVGGIYFQKLLAPLSSEKIHTIAIQSMNNEKEEQEKGKNDGKRVKLYELIGKDSQTVIEALGEPSRIDISEYDYDWWIYNQPLSHYCQIGIEGGKVVTVFVMGDNIDIAPFQIEQSLHTLKNSSKISEKISFEVERNLYRFELTAEELRTNPLVKYKNVWAQINIDQFTKKVSSIRFLDARTLVKIRPYELVYRGELISAQKTDPTIWNEIEKGKALQILDMTNVLRERNGLSHVNWDDRAAVVAYSHSREMFEEEYFSHSSPTSGDLLDRLVNGGVHFSSAGENIAARYVDAISVVQGWLNSEGHRQTLLNKDFTHLGVGVYEKYYTQNFIKAW